MDGKKVYQIQINGISESVNAVEALNKQLDALEKRIKNLEGQNIKVSSNASSIKEEIKAQKELNQLKKEEAAQERITANEYANTMKGMKENLKDIKTVLNSTDLGETGKIEKMTKDAGELTKKLKDMEQAYGQFGRNVGNYQSAFDGLGKLKIEVGGVVREFSSAREASRTLKNELTQLEVAEKGNTKQADELRSAYYKLQSAMDDATKSSKAMDNAMDFMQSFTAMASIGNGLQAFFGFDDNEITRSIQKLVALQGVLNGLETIRRQMETREGIGKILGKGFKDVDKWTYSLQRTNVALRGTGTSAHIAAAGIKVLNVAIKGLMSAGILIGLDLLVEGFQKLVGAIKDWVKGDADLVNASDVLQSALDAQNKVLEQNLELIQKSHDAGHITTDQARVLTEREYAKALEETNKRLKEREELIREQGIKGNSELYLGSAIGDKGVTTLGGFNKAIGSLDDFVSRWDYLEKRVEAGKDIFDSFFLGLLSTADDAKDEFNHLNKIIANDFVNAMYKFADGTEEGTKKLIEYIDSMDKLTDGKYSRAMKLVKVDNEALQKELDNAWAQIETLRDKVFRNPIVVRMELDAKISSELDKLDPTRVIQRNIDQWTQMLVFGIDDAGNKLTDAQRKNIEKIIAENKKNLAKQQKQKLDAERNASKKLAQEQERVEKELRQLRIENMQEGLDKEIAKLKEERREKLKQAEITGIRVGELTIEINKLYDKKEEDARREHAAAVKKIYDDMWEDILRSYDENFRMNLDSQLTDYDTQLRKMKDKATEMLNPRYASYGGTQLDNRMNDESRRSLGYDVLAKNEKAISFMIKNSMDYLDLLEEIEAAELELANVDSGNYFDIYGLNPEELEEKIQIAKKKLADWAESLQMTEEEFQEMMEESVATQDLIQVGYTKSISRAMKIRLNEAYKYYQEVERLEKEYAENAKNNELALLQMEKDAADREADNEYEEKLLKLEEYKKNGLLTEEKYNTLSEHLQATHEDKLKENQLRFTTESERIQQDYVDRLKEITNEGLRGMLNEYRDAFDNISKIQSKQPQLKSGILGDMGIIDFGLSKKKYEEALKGYQNLSRNILAQKVELQKKLDAKEISFDDFQQAKRELDGLAQDCADAAMETQDSLKNLTSDYIGSINQNLQLALQAISDIISVVFEAQNAAFEEEQEEIDKANEALDKALDKQQEIVKQHKDAIDSIEDELTTARGSRRQHLIDQLNAEMDAQRAAAAEEKRLQKEKEALDKKQEALDLKRKKAQYKNDIASIIVSGAMAAANGFATKPFIPVGLAMGALATTLTAAQLAIALSHKPYAKGGLLEGPSHKQGGIPVGNTGIEVEGKEYVIRKRSTAQNIDLLDYINKSERKLDLSDFIDFYSSKVKKNISSSSPRAKYADGGTIPMLNNDYNFDDRLLSAFEDYSNRPVYVSVVDINRRQTAVKNVQVLAGLGE